MARRWGSIQVRKNRDGTESIRIRYEITLPDGSKSYRSETLPHISGTPAPTAKDAERLLTRRHQELATDQFIIPNKETVHEFLYRWLEATASYREPATTYLYRVAIKNRITPYIGSYLLQRMSPPLILDWLNQLRSAGYKDSTVRTTYTVLAAALADAVRWRLIPRSPANRDALKLRFDTESEIEVWSPDEARAFTEAARRHPHGNLFLVMIETAMRSGELRALRWRDIDFDHGVILVDRTVSYTSSGTTEVRAGTKSHKPRRILIGASTIAVLEKTRTLQQQVWKQEKRAWSDETLVFARSDGRHIGQYALQPWINQICAAAGIKPLSPHQLRHTGTTLLLALGVPDRIVQERLGHTSNAMTRRYQHPSIEMQIDAVDRLSTMLAGGENGAS